MTQYQKQFLELLSPAELRVIKKLRTPQLVQDFLDHFPANFRTGDSIQSPRSVLIRKKADCMEGAVFAAAALAYHGHSPLLMDFQTIPKDEDHVVALFKVGKFWGAISKTNHPVLRWRDPIYKSPRELAMSYFNEYFMWNKKDGKLLGTKTLRAYSRPFDLSKYKLEKWWGAKDLDWLAEVLDASPHYPVVPKGHLKLLRKARPVEIKAMQLEEWPKPKK